MSVFIAARPVVNHPFLTTRDQASMPCPRRFSAFTRVGHDARLYSCGLSEGATSQTATKGIHHGTHYNRSNHRTQHARLPSMACHQEWRKRFLDQSWCRMAPPRRQRSVASTRRLADGRPHRSSSALAQVRRSGSARLARSHRAEISSSNFRTGRVRFGNFAKSPLRNHQIGEKYSLPHRSGIRLHKADYISAHLSSRLKYEGARVGANREKFRINCLFINT